MLLQLGKLEEAQMMLEDCLKGNADCSEAQKDLEMLKQVQLHLFPALGVSRGVAHEL